MKLKDKLKKQVFKKNLYIFFTSYFQAFFTILISIYYKCKIVLKDCYRISRDDGVLDLTVDAFVSVAGLQRHNRVANLDQKFNKIIEMSLLKS